MDADVIPDPAREQQPAVGGRLRRGGVLLIAVPVVAALVRLPTPIALPVLVGVLAGADVVAGLLANSWAHGRSVWVLLTGALLYAVAFWLYGVCLRLGHLSTVTLAWVVVVTVADILIDRFCFGTQLPPVKWLAMIVAVGALAYVLAGS